MFTVASLAVMVMRNKKYRYPIDGAMVQGGLGSYRWFVYITTLLLREASSLLDCIVGDPKCASAHLYC